LTVVVSGGEKFNPQHCNLTRKWREGGLKEERGRNQSAEPPKFNRTISRVLIIEAIESRVMKKDQSETLFYLFTVIGLSLLRPLGYLQSLKLSCTLPCGFTWTSHRTFCITRK